MATYLQLCNAVARESGTMGGTASPISAVTSQTGRSLTIVNLVADAYNELQIAQRRWRWLEGSFSGSTVASTQEYASSALSIASRFGNWIWQGEHGDNDVFSIYLTADGQDTERLLVFKDWPWYRRNCMIGSAASQEDYPHYVTITPDNKVSLWPIPDAVYTVRGLYQKSPQSLAADGDTPEMPSQYHDLIKWMALMKLAMYDEAYDQYQIYQAQAAKYWSPLQQDQLPRVEMPRALV